MISIVTSVNGTRLKHGLAQPPTVLNNNPGLLPPGNFASAGQQVRLYADGGTVVGFTSERTDTAGSASFGLVVSGHLVDVP